MSARLDSTELRDLAGFLEKLSRASEDYGIGVETHKVYVGEGAVEVRIQMADVGAFEAVFE